VADHPVKTQNSPFRLNLEQQRKRAKDLLHGLRAVDPGAIARYRKHHPNGMSLSDPSQIPRFARLSAKVSS
jgi:hypothetical protein